MLTEDLNLPEENETQQDSSKESTTSQTPQADEQVVETTSVEVTEIETTTDTIEVAEQQAPEVQGANDEVSTQVIEVAHVEALAEPIQEIEAIEDEVSEVDLSGQSHSKKDLVQLLEKLLESVKSEGATVSDMKNADVVLKEVKPVFDQFKFASKSESKKAHIAETGSDVGFAYQNDNYDVRYDSLTAQIRDIKTEYFKKLEQNREDSFTNKTKLLQELRELVASEEVTPSKSSWTNFKKIQDSWKAAGPVSNAHNQSLWAAYNALVDRYFSNRTIFNELMELDRKKNQQLKEALCEKMEALVGQLDENSLTNSLIKEANDIFEEYKHIGPAPKEVNETIWKKFKAGIDKLYDKRREQDAEFDKVRNEVLVVKEEMLKVAEAFTTFNSTSIQEWNAKTKEVQELQEQWNAIKGAMPREKGKEISKDFWNHLKSFFNNKSEFFKKIDSERASNLDLKNALIEEVSGFVAAEDFSANNTNRVIEIQKEWRTVGFVPEKFKESLFQKFKESCDSFFEGKRNSTSSADKEFDDNLAKKLEICNRIEKAASENVDFSVLNDLKAEFNAIGFVPRKAMKDTQTRFAEVVNLFIKNSSSVSGPDKNKMMIRVESGGSQRVGGNSQAAVGGMSESKKKIQKLEEEIALYRNNIEFFARSKNADSLRAEIEIKIAKAQKEIEKLKT